MPKPNTNSTVKDIRDFIRTHKLNKPELLLKFKKAELIDGLKLHNYWDDSIEKKKRTRKKPVVVKPVVVKPVVVKPVVDFKVKSSERKKLNNAFMNKYDITIYKILGLGSEAKAKKISPVDFKDMAKKLRLQNHPDKGGNADTFDKINTAIKIMNNTYN